MDIIIVDKDDTEIGVQSVTGIDYTKVIYRVSAIWVDNGRGEVLIAQRAFDKAHNPGCWGPSAAGTIEAGETYDQNIIHEVAEEIGHTLTLEQIVKGPKNFAEGTDPKRAYFTQWYYATIDKPAEEFVLQEEEVAAVRWISKEDLVAESTASPEKFLDCCSKVIELTK